MQLPGYFHAHVALRTDYRTASYRPGALTASGKACSFKSLELPKLPIMTLLSRAHCRFRRRARPRLTGGRRI
jgi:hypothetical protein